jgi:hypothetical protein
MDPLTASIVVILGKYALDKGVELGKEVGPKALDTAKEMFQVVLDRVKKVDSRTAEKYPANPEGYQVPMADAVEEATEADAEFKAQLQALLEKYEELAQAHAVATGRTYQATVSGSGGLAQDGSVATGEGGIAIGRDARGGIRHVGREKKEK